MKIRNGYISNSSSSSFIVAFPKGIEDANELKKIMFGSETVLQYYEDDFNTMLIANHVWQCMKHQKSTGDFNVYAEAVVGGILENGTYPNKQIDQPYSSDINLFEKRYTEDREVNEKRAILSLLDFMDKNAGKEIYTFRFSDNEGSFEAAMEHGDIFRKLDFLKINRH